MLPPRARQAEDGHLRPAPGVSAHELAPNDGARTRPLDRSAGRGRRLGDVASEGPDASLGRAPRGWPGGRSTAGHRARGGAGRGEEYLAPWYAVGGRGTAPPAVALR